MLPETPSGCTYCGVDRMSHPWLWVEGRGYHLFKHPTEDQVKARMIHRHNTRKEKRT